MKFKLQVISLLIVTVLAGLLFGREFGLLAGVGAAFLIGNALTFNLAQSQSGYVLGITVDAALKRTRTLEAALEAMKPELLPLMAFANVFNDQPLEGTNKIAVPFYPLVTEASKDWEGTYVFEGASLQAKEVEINQRVYQPFTYTSADRARLPVWDPVKFGRLKGLKLAEDCVGRILALITAANFPGTVLFTGAASTFDSDDVVDMKTTLDDAHWPKMGRSLILDTAYEGALLKDNDVKTSPSINITEDAMLRGEVPRLSNFGLRGTAMLPTNGENLVGAAVHESAILVAFSPITPDPAVMATLYDYESVTDEATGLTLEYRKWAKPGYDAVYETIECNFGFAVGDSAALRRIVSA